MSIQCPRGGGAINPENPLFVSTYTLFDVGVSIPSGSAKEIRCASDGAQRHRKSLRPVDLVQPSRHGSFLNSQVFTANASLMMGADSFFISQVWTSNYGTECPHRVESCHKRTVRYRPNADVRLSASSDHFPPIAVI